MPTTEQNRIYRQRYRAKYPEKVRLWARLAARKNAAKLNPIKLAWYHKNKNKAKITHQKWCQANKDRIRVMARAYYLKNRNAINLTRSKHRASNPEKYKTIDSKRNETESRRRWRKMWKSTPHQKIRHRIANRIQQLLKTNGTPKNKSTMTLVGTDLQILKKHIESLFKPGMTWDNMGLWHIDHIKACAKFDLTSEDQQRECFHYSNLQPLWETENVKKGAR